MIRKRLAAFRYALNGISLLFKETFHFKIHFIAAFAAIIGGLYFKISHADWLAIVLSIAIVFTTEAVNSAIEYTVDLSTTSHHPLAKKAKDVAAAAVLLAAVFSCIIACLIFLPYIHALWQ